jgi:hypothetical protein
VRRLGLRLELDLRDNLQRTLYATGTYEPALLRFLRASAPFTAPGTQVQQVVVINFDTWAAEHRVERLDLVKLNVEGAELAAPPGHGRRPDPPAPPRPAGRGQGPGPGPGRRRRDEVCEALHRLGYVPTGQFLPVAKEVYRRLEHWKSAVVVDLGLSTAPSRYLTVGSWSRT